MLIVFPTTVVCGTGKLFRFVLHVLIEEHKEIGYGVHFTADVECCPVLLEGTDTVRIIKVREHQGNTGLIDANVYRKS